jgi:putative exporter of polyketide antibiotics
MSRWQNLFLALATAVAGGSGLVLHVMKDWLRPADPFAVLNHPWLGWVLKAHLVSVPFLIFAVGLIFSNHVLEKMRGGRQAGRLSGLGLIWIFAPLVLSGVLIQVFTDVRWLRGLAWAHLAGGVIYLAAYVGHRLRTLAQARSRLRARRPAVRLASRRARS